MRERSQDSEAAIVRRLATARSEVSAVDESDYVVINDALDETVAELLSIVRAERHRTARCRERAVQIIASFPG